MLTKQEKLAFLREISRETLELHKHATASTHGMPGGQAPQLPQVGTSEAPEGSLPPIPSGTPTARALAVAVLAGNQTKANVDAKTAPLREVQQVNYPLPRPQNALTSKKKNNPPSRSPVQFAGRSPGKTSLASVTLRVAPEGAGHLTLGLRKEAGWWSRLLGREASVEGSAASRAAGQAEHVGVGGSAERAAHEQRPSILNPAHLQPPTVHTQEGMTVPSPSTSTHTRPPRGGDPFPQSAKSVDDDVFEMYRGGQSTQANQAGQSTQANQAGQSTQANQAGQSTQMPGNQEGRTVVRDKGVRPYRSPPVPPPDKYLPVVETAETGPSGKNAKKLNPVPKSPDEQRKLLTRLDPTGRGPGVATDQEVYDMLTKPVNEGGLDYPNMGRINKWARNIGSLLTSWATRFPQLRTETPLSAETPGYFRREGSGFVRRFPVVSFNTGGPGLFVTDYQNIAGLPYGGGNFTLKPVGKLTVPYLYSLYRDRGSGEDLSKRTAAAAAAASQTMTPADAERMNAALSEGFRKYPTYNQNLVQLPASATSQ